eukprot:CAMPEP_0179440670 /NCGR_PEP_ID=MMETSP0799-20121207/24271_1 /TAXON_ID=46947 /ORGANISM="Geminigera cryophila, Strain CCMP2564" /LENGTH=378 /DNA_ID=CAMNT_0021224255 /DNA_START=125 /DNA_END=1261 /DNA_ORIENTATION=-
MSAFEATVGVGNMHLETSRSMGSASSLLTMVGAGEMHRQKNVTAELPDTMTQTTLKRDLGALNEVTPVLSNIDKMNHHCPPIRPREGRPIFWVHVHKAGGTTICGLALQAQEAAPGSSLSNKNFFGQNCASVDKPCSYGAKHHSCTAFVQFAKKSNATFMAVEREIHDADLACHDDLFYGLTLRHPIDLVRSVVQFEEFHVKEIFAAIASNQSYPRLRRKNSGLPRTVAVTKGKTAPYGHQHFDNFMVRVLSRDGFLVPLGRVNRQHLEHAKKTLQHFDVLLIMEQFSNMFCQIQNAARWPALTASTIRNRFTGHRLTFSSKNLEILTALNRWDLELYEYALRLSLECYMKRCTTSPLLELLAHGNGTVTGKPPTVQG